MKFLFCGKLTRDTVMEWCQEKRKFTQHDQFLAGYNWEVDEVCCTNIEPFFNGVRVAVKQGKFEPEDISIIFLDDNGKEHRPKLDEDGRIDLWPMGFYDEETRALMELL